ncbi:MAG TPA: helix-turn-helix transcriptional regulator [Rubrivivax sp.]|nr:helix-turn-helix transcriptional regulator [Rubrivivax sp.]
MPSRRPAPLPSHKPARALVPPVDPQRFEPTRERPVRAKARQLRSDTEITPHSHAWAQVVVCASGVARITAAHSTYLVPAWRAVWIPPRVEHLVSVVEAADLRTLYVHQGAGRVGPGLPGEAGSAWRCCRVLEVSALLRELVLQMDVAMDGRTPMSPAALERERRLGELALDELCRAAPLRLGIELPRDKRLRALCEAILREHSRHATLQGWSRETAASPRTLARLFRQQLDTSFGPWRQQVLLAHALRLAAQRKPMALIAAELGYASPSAFSAMVRRAVGQPPSRFFATA